MKTRLSLLAVVLCSAFPSAHAAPNAPPHKRTHVLAIRDALADEFMSLFHSSRLNPELGPQRTEVRTYGGFSMRCNQARQCLACELEVEGEEESAAAMIFGAAAESLFNDLRAPEFESRTSDAKIYTQKDGLYSIYCSRSLVANGDRYACSMELL